MSEIELRDFKAQPLELGRSPALASLPSSPRADSKSTAAATWNVEKEVNGYFCAHTIEEIKKIEQSTRLLVEQKKEDLRQMVGERYRDLVDAADSVVEMKTHSEQVLQSVSQLHQFCEQLHQSHYLRGFGGMKGPASDNLGQLPAVTVQLRLLCDIPGKIWSNLEQGAYLQAANSYLLAHQVYTHLKLDRGPQTSPLVQGLWERTLALRPTIVESCQQKLQSIGIGEEEAVQSLCSVALLEGASPRQLFTQFLVARKAALQTVLNPTKQAHLSAKAVVCEAINAVRRSLLLVATIFSGHTVDGNQVASKLCVALHNAGNDKNKAVQQLLGRSQEATQGLKVAALSDVPESVVHSSCEQWITMTLTDIEEGVGNCLAHVTTIKAISAIRRSVHDLLTEPMTGASLDQRLTDSASQWKWTCDCVLGRPLSLHMQFLQRMEFSRIKSILTRLFGDVVAHAHSLLDSLLGGFVKDAAPLYALDCRVSAYLWLEEEGGSQKKGCNHDGMAKMLRLKAKGCTPNVYSFCEGFGEKLNVVIQEVSHFMPSGGTCGGKREVDLFPFSLTVDSLEIQSLLQNLTGDCIERFLEDIKSRLLSLQEEPAMQLLVLDKILFLARVCNSLCEFCPSLVLLLNGLRKLDPPRGVADGRLGRSRLQTSQKEAAAETPVLNLLQQQALAIFRIWADWCSGEFSLMFHKHVFGNISTNSLASVLAWEDITIFEEAESGQQLSSTICIPCQPSVYVTSLLYSVCKEISRVGSSTVDRSILEYLSSSLFGVMVTVHEQLMVEVSQKKLVIPQDCALQLLFNVRFLSRVLVEPAVMVERFKAICSQLQAFVDPFDLDVFMPHISSNLERHVQRSIVLLGLLVVAKGPQVSLTHQPPMNRGAQEKPSIVSVGQQVPRIMSLPISSAQSLAQQSHQLQDVRVETEQSLAGTFAFFHL